MILSNNCDPDGGAGGSGGKGQLWWQFYPRQDLDASRELIERAQTAGYTAIVVTVDQQASVLRAHAAGSQPRRQSAKRRRAWRTWRRPSIRRIQKPWAVRWWDEVRRVRRAQQGAGVREVRGVREGAGGAGGARGAGGGAGRGAAAATGPALYRLGAGRLWYTWQYLDDIRKFIKGPMLVKGIMTAEDAKMCVDRGVNGIIVSNHGGRSMDYGPASLEALPEIVAAVERPYPHHRGQRIPPRERRTESAGHRRQRGDVRPRHALGPGRLRACRRPEAVRRHHLPELVNAAAAAGTPTLAAINKNIIRTDVAIA
jgi:hypothetical protein